MKSADCYKSIPLRWVVGVSGAVCLGLSMTAAADRWTSRDSNSHYDYAKVTGVEPMTRIVEVSVPREVCWDERVRTADRGRNAGASYTPLAVGGLLGGVVGNQFGSGRGKTAMTVAGALLGASIGRDASARANSHQPARAGYAIERRCEIEQVMHEEERLDGYRVTYRLHGRDYVTRMASDPGDRIRVRVAVDPV